MPHPAVSTPRDNAPVFDLCNTREQHFLLDLIAQEEPGAFSDHPLPELSALLRAIERMWGGADAKELRVPPMLMYYLVLYAMMAHHIPEDVAEWRRGAAHEVYAILQGFMESVAMAIKNGSGVKHEDGRVTIDLFRVPQWYFEEVMNRRYRSSP